MKTDISNASLASVIVPIYNTQGYLVRCIESILNQTYTNMEIILVNDGSTDDSLSVCEEYDHVSLYTSMKFSRIKNYHKKARCGGIHL